MSIGNVLGRTALTVAGLAGLAAVGGCGGAVPAPTAFSTYQDQGGKFVCDAPKGWETTGGGKPDSPNSWAKFTSGGAEIAVSSDLAGSLFGDIAKSSGADGSQGSEPAVARVHPMGEKRMKDEYKNYKEREPKPFQSKGLGEGRRSTFTAEQTLGGKVFGYRATLLGGDRRMEILTTCSASNWQALKPAFERVITSMRTSP